MPLFLGNLSMSICKNHLSSIYARLRAKSSSSCSDYKVTAVAYSKKGNILGYSSNNIRSDFIPVRRGAGVHAEMTLIKKFGKRISYIVISRTVALVFFCKSELRESILSTKAES